MNSHVHLRIGSVYCILKPVGLRTAYAQYCHQWHHAAPVTKAGMLAWWMLACMSELLLQPCISIRASTVIWLVFLEICMEMLRWAVHPASRTIVETMSHTDRVVQDFLDQEYIHALYWQAFSPDMSPTKHVWDRLGLHVHCTAAGCTHPGKENNFSTAYQDTCADRQLLSEE